MMICPAYTFAVEATNYCLSERGSDRHICKYAPTPRLVHFNTTLLKACIDNTISCAISKC